MAAGTRPDHDPVQRFEGVYTRSFEVSSFVAAGSNERWWIHPRSMQGPPALQNDARGRVWADVTVTGRLSAPGGFGHLGGYRRELVVEEVLAAERREEPTITVTFDAADVETAAALVQEALGSQARLQRHDSPMIGPWYSDGDRITTVTLTINDPEPGVVPVEVVGGGRFVLRMQLPDLLGSFIVGRMRDLGLDVRSHTPGVPDGGRAR